MTSSVCSLAMESPFVELPGYDHFLNGIDCLYEDESESSESSQSEFRSISVDDAEDFFKDVLDISNNHIQDNCNGISSFYLPSSHLSPEPVSPQTGYQELHYNQSFPYSSSPASSSSSPPLSPQSSLPSSPTSTSSEEPVWDNTMFCNDDFTPSPTTPYTYYQAHHPSQYHSIKVEEDSRNKQEEECVFQEWTHFDHVKPDGTCKCLEKKNTTKCVLLKSKRRRNNQLWHFMLELLSVPNDYIRWLDRKAGVFRIEQSQNVAKLWGQRKKNPKMTYEHMSRGLRHYYLPGIMRRFEDKRLTYQFGPNAENWKFLAGLQNSESEIR